MTRIKRALQRLQSLLRPRGRDETPTTSAIRSHCLRGTLVGLAVFLVLATFSYALRSPILTGVAAFLVVDDSTAQADVIFLLTGDVHVRPFRAAELYHQNIAPEIVIARVVTRRAEELGLYPNLTDVSVQLLERLGVPKHAIRVLETIGGGN